MRRWYFLHKNYKTDLSTLYSMEDHLIYVHRISPLRGYVKDKSNFNTGGWVGFFSKASPMTLSWLIANIEYIPSHIPIATARQILEDLAHEHV